MQVNNQAGNRNHEKMAVSLACGWTMLAALAGCVSNVNGGLIIVQAQVPQSDDDGCTIPAGESELYNPSGRLDVGLDRDYGYDLYPLVRNNLLTGKTATRGETNFIALEGFRVKLVPPTGLTVDFSGCPAEFDFPNPKHLEPDDTAVGLVQAILPCHAARIRAALVARGATPDTEALFTSIVRAKGHHGGTEILSDDFPFPIRVCLGCLQRGFAAPGFEGFDYPRTPKCDDLAGNPFTGNPCNIAQDFGPILCCLRDVMGGTKLECPAQASGTAP